MHTDLIALINGDFRSRKLRLLAEMLPDVAFNIAARRFVGQYASLGVASINKLNGTNISLVLPPCKVSTSSVQHMQEWLNQHVKSDIALALLHGSLGSNEVVFYSDFDALVIIKDETLKDYRRLARVARRLFQARRFMYEQDPLQHHGWFVLPECAFSSWPEDYLPTAVLRHASVLTGSDPVKLMLAPEVNNERSKAALLGLTESIMRGITPIVCFKNLYNFKSIISKVLLLPALYVQARDGRGVFKRNSFNLAKSDFTGKEWLPVEVAGLIRQQWPPLNGEWPHPLWGRPGLLGNIWRKNYSPPVPVKLREHFNEVVVNTLKDLIWLMRKSIGI